MTDQQLYTAAAAVVKVSVGGPGPRVAQILRRGDVLPLGIDQERLDQLEARGLIEKVPTTETAPAGDAGSGPTDDTPTKPGGNAGFDKQYAWAQHLGIEVPADVVEAKDKDQVKALIAKHEADTAGSGK
ncbi:hypothetical protein ACX12M_17165 [Cellulosimicrobium cellulans]